MDLSSGIAGLPGTATDIIQRGWISSRTYTCWKKEKWNEENFVYAAMELNVVGLSRDGCSRGSGSRGQE
jgi:hypothetical protein